MAVVMGRVGVDVGGPVVEGDRATATGSRKQRVGDKAVVLAEANEDAAEHPRHRDLRVEAFSPLGLGERRTPSLFGTGVLGLDDPGRLRVAAGQLPEVVDQSADEGLAVGEQGGGVDHVEPPGTGLGRVRWRLRNQASGRAKRSAEEVTGMALPWTAGSASGSSAGTSTHRVRKVWPCSGWRVARSRSSSRRPMAS